MREWVVVLRCGVVLTVRAEKFNIEEAKGGSRLFFTNGSSIVASAPMAEVAFMGDKDAVVTERAEAPHDGG